MGKYKRCLGISNTNIKYLGTDPVGFASLYDRKIPYYQLAMSCVFWKLNIDHISKDTSEHNRYVVRFGPNNGAVPPVGYRAGYLTKEDSNYIFDDINEELIFSEALILELLRLQNLKIK